MEFPKQANDWQKIKDIENKDKINKDLLNIHPSIYQDDRKKNKDKTRLEDGSKNGEKKREKVINWYFALV